MKKVLIVVPTYNERKNIEAFLKYLFNITTKIQKVKIEVLVVDDNSPDKTYELVETMIKKNIFNNKLFLIKREKKLGLGTAYIEGFKWGLKKGYDILVQMDADFSHNPKFLPNMLNEMENFDFVIGSRYINGGKIIGWGPFRKFLSFGGSLYSRIILNSPIKDQTGGFNLWNKKIIESINLENITSQGYSFQIELKYRAYKKGFRFKEYPIVFEERSHGKSKMSIKIFLEAVWKVIKFRFISPKW
jgi:dolichol-phosphate mannosyltransferase